MARKVVKFIAGKIVKVDELSLSGVRHSNQSLQNFRAALKGFKKFRTNQFKKAQMFRPGGTKDPVRMAADNLLMERHRRKEFKRGLMGRMKGKDELTQRRIKKSADKIQGIFGGIEEIFKGSKSRDRVRHFTPSEVAKLAGKPATRRDFLEFLQSKVSSTKFGDAAEVLDPVGTGPKARKIFENIRRRDAKRLAREVKSQLPKGAALDRKISARGKGVRFFRDRFGRLRIARPKRGKKRGR